MNETAGDEAAFGLTSEEAQARIAAGEANVDAGVKTRSVGQIVHDNVCTLFNLVNAILALIVLFTGSYKNMLFMVVIVCNTVIGIVQEVRSKRITDKLSIIAGSKAHVLRDNLETELPLDQLVRDDVVVLRRGDQVPADAEVVSGECRVNESLLTGEADLVRKQPGDTLMSGSFINSGTVYARVIHIGAENYAAKISAEAKERKAVCSEIMRCLNGIIKFVSCIMFPLGALLFARDYLSGNSELNSAILSTVSALVGMIPEGLILLTSTVLAVAVVRLSKSQVLVQQLYCIETLARVDVLCLDKTGTITTGDMEVAWVRPTEGEAAKDESEMLERETRRALRAIACADDDPNETSRAIADYFKDAEGCPETCSHMIPFSSEKKWSGVQLSDGSCYVMGAAQFVLGDDYERVRSQVERLAADARLLLIARVQGFDELGGLQGSPQPLGFVGIRDQIRPTAAETVAYFKDQGVRVLVISGDDSHTVSGIAAKVGVEGAESFVDATTLKTESDVERALACDSVFGRVRPEQKKQFVLALQKAGHTVAMTGDGVNDTLAFKAADCSIAMASGSDSARNVAQLVLVDNDFASMPKVVPEGRRSINNLQRSASLFLVKTLLSTARRRPAVHSGAMAIPLPAYPDDAHQRIHHRNTVLRACARAESRAHQRPIPGKRHCPLHPWSRVLGMLHTCSERSRLLPHGAGLCTSVHVVRAADVLDRMQPGGPAVHAVHGYTFGVARGGSGRHRWRVPSYAQRVLHRAVHAGHVGVLRHRRGDIRRGVPRALSQARRATCSAHRRIGVGAVPTEEGGGLSLCEGNRRQPASRRGQGRQTAR